ncbi:cytochrome b [Acuticoccus sp.]|uniref:cytochrome b n=1 Tax=Acuticoccus sp. TaxID=1904378 RepID=UPI003B526832
MTDTAHASASPLVDTPERYGIVSRDFHWMLAILIVYQLTTAALHAFAPDTPLERLLFSTHFSMGFTILTLGVLRVLWAASSYHHRPPHEGPPFERFSATVGQVVLYALLIAVPFLGFILLISLGHGLTVWGVTLIPEGGTPNEGLASLVGWVHVALGWTFASFIVAHIVIALVHHFGKRDPTLERMVVGRSDKPSDRPEGARPAGYLG